MSNFASDMIKLTLLASFIVYSTQLDPMGPFKVVVTEFSKCKNQGTHYTIYSTKLSVVKRNSPLVLNGNFSNTIAFDDNAEATLYVSKWGNGGWKDNAWVQKIGGICSTMSNFLPDFFQRLLKSMDLEKCPIPIGNHTIKNFVLKVPFNIPVAPYGKWKADVVFSNTKIPRIGCLNLVYDVVPTKGHANY